jgi:hypothetical protein
MDRLDKAVHEILRLASTYRPGAIIDAERVVDS